MSQLLPLDKCIICVIGVIVTEELSRISRIISELGGTYSPQVTDKVYCVLVKKVGPQQNAIEVLNTPAIELQWLWDCRSYHRKLSFDQYYAKPFIGLCISCTGYTNDERNLIEKCVTENGGEFSSKMSRETCTHLITEEEDPSSTSKFAYAKLWRTVQIVTMKWLTECKKKKSWISEYEYLVSTATAVSRIEEKRLKEEKKTRVEKHSNVVVVANSRDFAVERSSSFRNNDKSEVVKKRKLHDVAYVPTIADLPSYELLNYSRCKSLLNLQTFFIAGFSPEIQDYIVRLILFSGGRRHHVLNASVTRILLGSHCDDRLVTAARMHPSGAECVTLSWLINVLFSTLAKADKDSIIG